MAYWLFQSNPKYYRIMDGIRDFEQMLWSVTRYAKDMVSGDGVLIWVSGEQAGIYAIAPTKFLNPPKTSPLLLILVIGLIPVVPATEPVSKSGLLANC